MITAIIFSKNRPMQLDCLLGSLNENCKIFHDTYVLYKSTNELADAGYEKLKRKSEVVFQSEMDFHLDTISLISGSSQYICFFVDDDICYHEVELVEVLDALLEVDILSLRLSPIIKKHRNYKGSLDGHIYKREDIKKAIFSKKFSNPNKLESVLTHQMRHKSIAWFNEQKVIGIPHNKVSDTSTCSDLNGDVNLLNQKYLEGYVIDYKQMNLRSANVHKNVNYAFRLA